ncbi:MAG: L-aspartate oxidase [Dehalococcoidia bacterium]
MTQPDFRTIVLGSGISGLFVALEARKLGPVLVVTKSAIEDCNTQWAQGGIAAAVSEDDSALFHLEDTIEAGDGLVDPEAARVLCEEAPGRIRDLVTYGVAFDSVDGRVALGLEAAHSRPRILHAGGDRTGAAIETALGATARTDGITILDHTLATEILVRYGRAAGVRVVDLRSGKAHDVSGAAVVVATGGAGQLFSHTTNPEVATGDGIALAYLAGAELMDLEFYQFHPTAFRRAGAPPFLISEAVRGEGAILRNAAGDAFMPRYDARSDLAPRDVVARACLAEMRTTGTDAVSLDCRALKVDLPVRFPGIYAFCHSQGLAMERDFIPVAPAAHYFMGGIRTDTSGRTNIAGLFACGEAACTGVHGANRLASNSLMETIVFGKRVVDALGHGAAQPAAPSRAAITAPMAAGAPRTKSELQAVMWECAGIERQREGLEAGTRAAAGWGEPAPPTRDATERASLALLARLVLDAATRRTESRGAHKRLDYPSRNDHDWKRHQVYRHA